MNQYRYIVPVHKLKKEKQRQVIFQKWQIMNVWDWNFRLWINHEHGPVKYNKKLKCTLCFLFMKCPSKVNLTTSVISVNWCKCNKIKKKQKTLKKNPKKTKKTHNNNDITLTSICYQKLSKIWTHNSEIIKGTIQI